MIPSVVLPNKVIKPPHTMTALKNARNYFPLSKAQDIYLWLEKFENQFHGCVRKLDSACLAANLACYLTGLVETY